MNPFTAYERLVVRLYDQAEDINARDGQAGWSAVLLIAIVIATFIGLIAVTATAFTASLWLGWLWLGALVGGFLWTAVRRAFPKPTIPESDDVKETYGREDAK